jgi:adenylate kinase
LVCRDKEALFERMRRRALKQNRVDDAKPDVIRRRFEVYEAETKPVLDFYPRESIIEVDAMGSPAEVLMHILDEIVPLQKAHFDLQSSESGD